MLDVHILSLSISLNTGTTSQESPGEEHGSDDKGDDDYDEEDDDDEYDDVEEILLEKRVTFHMMEGNQWQVSSLKDGSLYICTWFQINIIGKVFCRHLLTVCCVYL